MPNVLNHAGYDKDFWAYKGNKTYTVYETRIIQVDKPRRFFNLQERAQLEWVSWKALL